EGVTHAVERKRVVGSFGDDPLGRLGKRAALAGAAHPIPTLENVDRVNQDREHQPLFAAESAAAHPAEELTRQNYVGQRESISPLKFTLRLFHFSSLLLERAPGCPTSGHHRPCAQPPPLQKVCSH